MQTVISPDSSIFTSYSSPWHAYIKLIVPFWKANFVVAFFVSVCCFTFTIFCNVIIKSNLFFNISPYKAQDTTDSKSIWIQNLGMVPETQLAKNISKQVTGYLFILIPLFRLTGFQEHMQTSFSNVWFYNTLASLSIFNVL